MAPRLLPEVADREDPMPLRAIVRRAISTLLTLGLLAACTAWAQAPTTAEGAPLQVDVVVVDRHGNPVTDLKAGDFEIVEKNARPAVLDCQFVSAADAPRTTTFVVDDLALSIRSVSAVRDALARFVDTQM